MSKAIPIATIIRRHSIASKAVEKASAGINAVKTGILGTFIAVPEFGANHVFTIAQIDTLATRHEEQRKWAKGSRELATFRARIEAYRKVLTDLLVLKEQWREKSGLNALEADEREAREKEIAAWDALLSRLKSGRDTAPITRYLAADSKVLEPWRLKQALKALTLKARRRT